MTTQLVELCVLIVQRRQKAKRQNCKRQRLFLRGHLQITNVLKIGWRRVEYLMFFTQCDGMLGVNLADGDRVST